ncbi:branched-chain amino acid aminotransferase [Bacillus sp. FJAT-29814]|uniref:branched-chain amino acid aminotransferase n=1 Tax=Bacillus sp. FJAT-29814 TaxID=1729688 RepID=UPI00082A6ACB|nr:branched-chain amino acid aminotransferase [Bacillus sp. FJAT-29814]
MLKDQIKQYMSGEAIFKEEKEYAEKHGLADTPLIEKEASLRFEDAYIERCDKETENLIRTESASFLTQPLVFLKKHKNEFIYLESKWFDVVRAESVSIEADDVFGTYDVMLGIKLQKKYDKKLQQFLNNHLHSESSKFDLLFNGQEGLWDLNFALNSKEGFDENMSIGEGYQLVYQFLFKLMESMEEEDI